MRRIRMVGLGLAVVAGSIVGCGDEDPVSVGSDLIGEGFRTFEVVLESEAFLQADTTFPRRGSLNQAPFWLLANQFGGELEAHTLFRISIPTQATYEEEGGATVQDSVAAIRGATLTLVIDTLSDAAPPVDVEVLALTESWERQSVSWELRYDTAEVAAPWTEPGGTTNGEILGQATWVEGDTVRVVMDSAHAAVWHDSAGAELGALVRLATPGSRLRIESLDFTFDVVAADAPEADATGGSALATVSIASPDSTAATPEELRVGGLPSWRSLLHFRPLSGLAVPCGDPSGGCTVLLEDVTLNLATLVLQPQPVAGRRIERPVRLEGHAVIEAPSVPLARSPLSPALGRMTENLTWDAFEASSEEVAAVPITEYVRRIITSDEEETPLWLALTLDGEQSVFGYTRFGSASSATPPRLRLVVTAPVREVNQ